MSTATHENFSAVIAARIESERHGLAARWLDRLVAVIPVRPLAVFPSEALLDHIPELIKEIARFVAAPEEEIAGNTFVVAKARELGELRHEQHASVHQLLREYELLRSILETFVGEQAEDLRLAPHLTQVIGCLRRINQGVAILTQTTVDTFVERYTQTIDDQTARLIGFNRMVSHELRQPLGALQTASSLLRQISSDTDAERRQRLVAAVERSALRMVELVSTITKMSGLTAPDDTKPGVQRISLITVAQEAARQLRDSAGERDVQIDVAPDLPDVTVDVGQLELVVTNLLSNAIKYSDPAKSQRRVEVSLVRVNDSTCTFRVRDNGLGMTPEQVHNVFTPFYRGHANRDKELGVEGLGLGLSIVQDCARAIGASIEVESTLGESTTFTITMPVGTYSK
jgi:signal transduction histidine kinase